MKGRYTRSGARRSGDDYQDIMALELAVEFLEHPDRYEWIQVEADDFGALDDIVALRSDGGLLVRQVKYSTDPEPQEDAWTWEHLLKQKEGKQGKQLNSLLQKWATGLHMARQHGPIQEASVVTNRRPADDLALTLTQDGRVDFDKVTDPTVRDSILKQVGGESEAQAFFGEFRFFLDKPSLNVTEESVRRRVYGLGVGNEGWLRLKEEMRFWVRERREPPPDGRITLGSIKRAVLWIMLQSLPQHFEIPKDYILSSQSFHDAFTKNLMTMRKGCVVLTASPGAGKSTYLSYLFRELRQNDWPVIRHHYFLSVSDRTPGRLDHQRVAESLMSDVQSSLPEALGSMGERNPSPTQLARWIDKCGAHLAEHEKALIVIIDGLDHVWRQKGSAEELGKLFEHLLPAPEGVVLVVGMQPLDNSKLPLALTRAAPRGQWCELPLFDREAVRRWLLHHKDELDLPSEGNTRERRLDSLADALHGKCEGHPLHLRYTLRALHEQGLPVTERNIARLPGCPHHDIEAYYTELCGCLPEAGQAILHLFAACRFPWPIVEVIECLEQSGSQISDVAAALRQVRHLTAVSPLGLRPFHNSLLVFVSCQEDHETYSGRLKKLALQWLRTKAPEHYWRWAHEWQLEADLGNDQPLVEGPNRHWVVDGIARRLPRQDSSEILARSAFAAMQRGDLARFVRVGLLRDYLDDTYRFRPEVFEVLLYSQLILREDPHLRARLEADISDLTDEEIAVLAHSEALSGNYPLAKTCFDELNERLNGTRKRPEQSGGGGWHSEVEPLLRVAALIHNIIAPERIVRFAIAHRDDGYSADLLATYAEALRAGRATAPLRSLLQEALMAEERSIVLRHATLLAFEEGFDLSEEICKETSQSDAFANIYASLREARAFQSQEIRFPSTDMLGPMSYDVHLGHNRAEDFFYSAFFCLLGNHLWNRSGQNEKWLARVSEDLWGRHFVDGLNPMASELSQLLAASAASAFRWFYERMKSITVPHSHRDWASREQAAAARKTVHQIALDVLILASEPGVEPTISKEDLEAAFESGYCRPRSWIDVYLSHDRQLLDREAVEWLLAVQATELDDSIQLLSERAAGYAELAALATLHGLEDRALHFVHEAASNLLTHGDHKDVLLFGALDVITTCHQADLPEARSWLLKTAPAIAAVTDFTDGDETGNLASHLAEVLADVAPDLLPGYYGWLCDLEEYYDATHAFHVFLRTSDLSSELAEALAKTALDEVSVEILVFTCNSTRYIVYSWAGGTRLCPGELRL